jgi:hypothetical protein
MCSEDLDKIALLQHEKAKEVLDQISPSIGRKVQSGLRRIFGKLSGAK